MITEACSVLRPNICFFSHESWSCANASSSSSMATLDRSAEISCAIDRSFLLHSAQTYCFLRSWNYTYIIPQNKWKSKENRQILLALCSIDHPCFTVFDRLRLIDLQTFKQPSCLLRSEQSGLNFIAGPLELSVVEPLVEQKKSVSFPKKTFDMVRKAIMNKLGRITKQDIREMCSSLSDSSIEGALRKLVNADELKREGSGKATRYIPLKWEYQCCTCSNEQVHFFVLVKMTNVSQCLESDNVTDMQHGVAFESSVLLLNRWNLWHRSLWLLTLRLNCGILYLWQRS